MPWAEVVSKLLDLFHKPTGLGALLLVVLALYIVPLAVVTWTSWDNTNRLEAAIVRLGDRFDQYLTQKALHPGKNLTQ